MKIFGSYKDAHISTPWKNYTYPMYRLSKGDGTLMATAANNEWASSTNEPHVYVNDDWFNYGNKQNAHYQLTIEANGGDGSEESIDGIFYPQFWDDGTEGQYGALGSISQEIYLSGTLEDKLHWNMKSLKHKFKLLNEDQSTLEPFRGASLLTLTPGVMVAIPSTDTSHYTDNTFFRFTINKSLTMDKIKRTAQYPGGWTCWIKHPKLENDSHYTKTLPPSIGRGSFTLFVNIKHHCVKSPPVYYGDNLGCMISVLTSEDNENWVADNKGTILGMDLDFSDDAGHGGMFSLHHDVTGGTEGDAAAYRKILFHFLAAPGSGRTLDNQWIQVGIIPS